MAGHRGYNICPWLKNGKPEICGKSCREEYCKEHRAKVRAGIAPYLPCLRCGAGVRSQIQLCRGCGREKERKNLKRKEERERKMRDFIEGRWAQAPVLPQTPAPILEQVIPRTKTPSPPPIRERPKKEESFNNDDDTCNVDPKYGIYYSEYCFGLRD